MFLGLFTEILKMWWLCSFSDLFDKNINKSFNVDLHVL